MECRSIARVHPRLRRGQASRGARQSRLFLFVMLPARGSTVVLSESSDKVEAQDGLGFEKQKRRRKCVWTLIGGGARHRHAVVRGGGKARKGRRCFVRCCGLVLVLVAAARWGLGKDGASRRQSLRCQTSDSTRRKASVGSAVYSPVPVRYDRTKG